METKTYIVVDENNHWLAFGDFRSPEEAVEEAKEANEYSPRVKLFVNEVVKEYVFKPEDRGEESWNTAQE